MLLAGFFCFQLYLAGLWAEEPQEATKKEHVPGATSAAEEKKAEPLPGEEKENLYEESLLLAKVIELIREHYVDESKTSYSQLFKAALRGMVASLDRHSQFLDEREFKELQEETDGDYVGVGIILGEQEGRLVILAAFEGSPAAQAGIRPGDWLHKINDVAVAGMTIDEAVALLRGNRGERVTITVLRQERKPLDPDKQAVSSGEMAALKTLSFEVTRDRVHVSSVKDVGLVSERRAGEMRIGYVRLEQFGSATGDEFRAALKRLEELEIEALILDLRNNPGGLLDAAVEVAGAFLESDKIIMTTEGRSGLATMTYRARGLTPPKKWPLVVLVNGFSASASEIVAGALKDHNRAMLVGEKTFGKGSVQSVVALDEKNGLRLTTAYYYTPRRTKIHGVGIDPDIVVPITLEQERALYQHRWERYLRSGADARIDWTVEDPQMERAISALKSVLVHRQQSGGNGATRP
ncbi:MAG: S41 family peptidase [Methylacidiphilales bacterium]|nr:S41 family peptidase [Candidatus Methylacidiphilales bacterium]